MNDLSDEQVKALYKNRNKLLKRAKADLKEAITKILETHHLTPAEMLEVLNRESASFIEGAIFKERRNLPSGKL